MANYIELDDFDEDLLFGGPYRKYKPYADPYNESDVEFRRKCQFSKDSVSDLANLLSVDLERISDRKCAITTEQQLHLAL